MTQTSASIPTLTMSDGRHIPQLGFGTYKIAGAKTQAIIEQALELGYRHIDTAQMYDNEAEVGSAITASGIPREEIFLTTKLNNDHHEPDSARRSLDESLTKLQTDHVDLFLIHWPMPKAYGGSYPETWRVMQEFVADGRARTVGVSNFDVPHLERLLAEVGVMPAINQIEAHPLFRNDTLRAWTKEHGGIVEAWRPIIRGEIFDDPQLSVAAERLGHTPAQLVLRWHIERGDVVFPKSVHLERMRENMGIFDFSLDEHTRAILDGMDRGEAGRTGPHPNELNEVI
ncbi:MAG: aldo/keto reductase [Actinomycetaceae bacterium]|nr:aldo/keto reductase [Actinomycetaceae bacterium]MDY5854503.1 aldo/keto reductase [Arcanobacterium sp.]